MSDNPNPIQIPIIFDLEAQQAAQSLSAVQKLVEKTRQEVEAFANRGGLGQLAERSGLIDDAQNQITDLGITLARTAGEAELLGTAITEVGQDSAKLNDLTARLNEVQAEAKQAVDQLEQIPDALAVSAQATRRAQFQESVNAISGLGGFEGLFTNTRGLVQSGGGIVGLDSQTIEGLSKFLELGGDITGTIDAIPRAIKGFEDLRNSITALQAAGALSSTNLLASAGALGLVAAAAYGVSVAYKDSLEKAIAPVRSFIEGLEDVDVSAIDSSTITTIEQLEALRQEQEAYARTLEENIAKTQGFVDAAENSGDTLVRTADKLGLPQYENAVNEARAATDQYNEELAVVRANLELLTNGLLEVSLAANAAAAATDEEFEKKKLQLQIDRGLISPDQAQQQAQDLALNIGATEQTLRQQRDAYIEALTGQVAAIFPNMMDEISGILATMSDPLDQIAELEAHIANAGQELTPGTQALKAEIDSLVASITEDQGLLAIISDPVNIAKVFEAAQAEKERQRAIEEVTVANNEAIEAETRRNRQLLDDAAKTSQSLQALESKRAEELQKQHEAEAEAAIVASFKTRIEAAKAIEAEQDRANKVTALRVDAHNKEVEAQAKHQQTLARQQAQFDLSQRRRQEDLADDLDEAAQDRDVKSFLRIQKDGEKELDRAAEDNELRQRELQDGLSDQLREIRRSAEDRIRAERDSGQRRLTQSQRIEQELVNFQQNAARQKELNLQRVRDEAYQRERTALQNHMAQITRELLNGITPLARGALGVLTGTGGLPTVPATAGAGSAIRVGAGTTIALTIQNQNVGRIATPEDITRANQDLANRVVNGVNRALAGIGSR